MRPLFPLLACSAVGLMMAEIVATHPAWLGLASASATLGAHAVACRLATRGRAEVGSRAVGLGFPGWVDAQGEKNAAKVGTVAIVGAFLACSILAISRRGGEPIGLLAFGLAFQVVAFGGEFAGLVAQSRLTRTLSALASGPSGP